MSKQVENALNPAPAIEKMSLEDFSKLQKRATCTYAKHFPDPLQAATDDVLGQCLEALQSCANVMQHMINDGDGTNCPYDELEEVNRILAMTGGGVVGDDENNDEPKGAEWAKEWVRLRHQEIKVMMSDETLNAYVRALKAGKQDMLMQTISMLEIAFGVVVDRKAMTGGGE